MAPNLLKKGSTVSNMLPSKSKIEVFDLIRIYNSNQIKDLTIKSLINKCKGKACR